MIESYLVYEDRHDEIVNEERFRMTTEIKLEEKHSPDENSVLSWRCSEA